MPFKRLEEESSNIYCKFVHFSVPSSLSVEAYERRIQRLEREKTELVRKLTGMAYVFIERRYLILEKRRGKDCSCEIAKEQPCFSVFFLRGKVFH